MNIYMRNDTIIVFLTVLFSLIVFSSASAISQEVRYNPISTAVPFLTITPDSRHGAMGEVGAATSPDANSQYMNPSKFAFARDKWGFALSFTPWLRRLVSDVNLAYISGFYQLDPTQAIGTSLRYFSMGAINLVGADKTRLGSISPGEFALDFSYSRRLSDYFSGGVSLRYIRSDLGGGVGGTQVGAESYSAGNAFATDVSFYYHHLLGGEDSKKSFSAGANFSNIGSKISYNQGSTKEFLPANLRIGTSYIVDLGDSSSVALSLDLNKLLVPTPSYRVDNSGNVVRDNNLNKSVISSIFGSFSDAPGGMKEELQEVTVSLGVEYWYKREFAVRAGYFNESQYKGNRKYFTAGIGVKLNIASVDVAYLIPVEHNNPLANTIRFSLLFNMDSFLKRKKANTVSM